jgi:ubiquinone/menaquinone biosynthesis C-methylase UbiE
MNQGQQNTKAFTKQYAAIAAEGHDAVSRVGDVSVAPPQSARYSEEELKDVPEGAVQLGLGCGNPSALAELQPGQIVLDLGSGGGLDAFIAARRVGPTGKVIGVDITPEMVEKATRFAREGGYQNVEFRVGQIEKLPVVDESIDTIISNCVINHSTDKLAVFKEAFRVLKPNGRICVSDLLLEGEPPSASETGMEVWAEWLTVAGGRQEYLDAVKQAGFTDIAALEYRPDDPEMFPPALVGTIVSLQLRAQKRLPS